MSSIICSLSIIELYISTHCHITCHTFCGKRPHSYLIDFGLGHGTCIGPKNSMQMFAMINQAEDFNIKYGMPPAFLLLPTTMRMSCLRQGLLYQSGFQKKRIHRAELHWPRDSWLAAFVECNYELHIYYHKPLKIVVVCYLAHERKPG